MCCFSNKSFSFVSVEFHHCKHFACGQQFRKCGGGGGGGGVVGVWVGWGLGVGVCGWEEGGVGWGGVGGGGGGVGVWGGWWALWVAGSLDIYIPWCFPVGQWQVTDTPPDVKRILPEVEFDSVASAVVRWHRHHAAKETSPWASYQIRKIARCAWAGNAGNVFPTTAG